MGKNIQTALGARIRKLRKAQEWSQERLAESSGMHWTYIGQVERGERNLTLQSIQAIAKALNLKISELFRGMD
ncbi:MAG: helix-turn-helix transcriptional regulator [Terracidiphilus sp.]